MENTKTYETGNKTDCTGSTVCPSGAAQAVQSDDPSTTAANRTGIPEEVKGWCWGCFLLNWIWAIENRTWIGLLCAMPYVALFVMPWESSSDRQPVWIGLLSAISCFSLGVAIWLGIKGRELAWKNREWKDMEHFNRAQRDWMISGIVINLLLVIGLIVLVSLWKLFWVLLGGLVPGRR